MTGVLLAAGKATRLGQLAPHGCKALVKVGGETMLDHWRGHFGDELLVVCRSEHADLLPDDVRRVTCDTGGGPAVALAAALPQCGQGPTTVAYADTWVKYLPEGHEWCAVGAGAGGRSWDVVEDGLLAYRYVDFGEAALVGIGLFRFAELWRLELALDHEIRFAGVHAPGIEIGLADVANALNLPLAPALGWQDVGDPAALAAWRPM